MNKRRHLNHSTYTSSISAAPVPEHSLLDVSIKDLEGNLADLIMLAEEGPFAAYGFVQLNTNRVADCKRSRLCPILEYSLDYPENAPCTVWIRTHDAWYRIISVTKSFQHYWRKMTLRCSLLGYAVHHMLYDERPQSNGDENMFDDIVVKIAHSMNQSESITLQQIVANADFLMFQLQQQTADRIVMSNFLSTLSCLISGSVKNPLTWEIASGILRLRKNQHKNETSRNADGNGNDSGKRRAKRSNICIDLDSSSETESFSTGKKFYATENVSFKIMKWKCNDFPCILSIPSISSVIENGVFECFLCSFLLLKDCYKSGTEFVQHIQKHLHIHIFKNNKEKGIKLSKCNSPFKSIMVNKNNSNYENIGVIKSNVEDDISRKNGFKDGNDFLNPLRININPTSKLSPLLWESTGIIPTRHRNANTTAKTCNSSLKENLNNSLEIDECTKGSNDKISHLLLDSSDTEC